MTDDQQLTLWVGACRYYIGRRTYAVSDFCEMLRHQWASLPRHVRMIIARDVDDAFRQDDEWREISETTRALGMDCDRKQWEKVRKLWADVPETHFGDMAEGLTIPRSAGG